MRKAFLLIENPAAGGKHRALLRTTIDALSTRGAIVTLQSTEYPGHAMEIARAAAQRSDVDAVIASGGDGSIRETAKGLLGSSMPLGIIPSGTGNVLAFELQLNRSPAALAHYLLTGELRTIKPSLANGEPFLLMAGVGYDAAVVAAVAGGQKRRIGKAAFAVPAVRTLLFHEKTRLRITVDDRTFEAGWIIATHASRYAGRMTLTRGTNVLDGHLQLIAVDTSSRVRLATRLALLAIGRLVGARGVSAHYCSQVEISSDTPVPVQIDGDPFGMTPLVIAPGSESLQLIIPARSN